MNDRLKRLFTAASIVYVNQALIILATVGVNFKVIAHLGAHRFGIYSTVLAYTSFFCIFTFSSGVDELVIKDLASGDADRRTVDEHLTTAFVIRLVLGAAAFLLSCAGAYLLGYDDFLRHLILVFSLSMLFSFHRRNSLFVIGPTIHERRLLPELATFLITTAVLGLKLFLAAADASLTWFVAADLSLVWGLSAAFLLGGVRWGHFSIHPSRFRPGLVKAFLSRGAATALGTFFIMISMRVDQVMLSKMQGMEAVGIYSVAVQLVEGFNFLLVIAGSLLLPIFSRNSQKKLIMLDILSISFRTAAWVSLSIVVLYWAAGEHLLSFIWGTTYSASLAPLRILAWSEVFVFIGTLNWIACICYGFLNYYLIINFVLAVLNVALNLALIPQYGPTGAAASTCISYGFGFVLMWFFPRLRELSRIIWRQSLPLAAGVAVPAFCFSDSLAHSGLMWAAIIALMTLAVIYANFQQAQRLMARP